MKFYLPLALIVGASTVAAQDQQMEQMLKILPKCATGCGLGSPADTCGETDILCTCKDREYLDGIACCISKNCSEHETEVSVKFASKLCGGVGVDDIPTQATCAATATATSTSSSAGSSSSGSSSSSSPSPSNSDSSSAASALNSDMPLFAAAFGAAAIAFLA